MNVRHVAWLALFGLVATSCSEELSGPQPSISDPVAGEVLPVDPGLICNAQHPEEGTPITVTGDALSPVAFDVPGEPKVSLPDLMLTRTSAVDGGTAGESSVEFGGEPGDPNADLLTWASQTAMTFSVTNGLAIEAGVYDLTVTNADGSTATSAAALAVVDRPIVTIAGPGLVCVAQEDREIAIEGSDFLRIGDALATVSLGDNTYEPTLGGCADIAHPAIDAETCTSAGITIPAGSLEDGIYDVTIQNPETAACTSLAEEDGITIQVVGPPSIDAADPAAICSESAGTETITFTGSNFINADGEDFTVTVNGAEVTPDSVDGCTAVENAGFDAEICTSFTVTVDLTGQELGGVEVSVTNPDIVGCGQTTSEVFAIVGPPTVTSVEPAEICSDRTETVTLRGTGFGPTATVMAGTEMADMVEFISSEELRVTFTDGLAAGTYDITVDNGGGCTATATGAIVVNPTPITFFVDPRVVYNGITIEVTVFTSGLQADAATVELIDDMGNITDISGFASPQRPNRILATIEAGLAPGEYEVRVTSQDGCESLINGRLTVTDNLTLNLDSITPAFASPTVDTAVTMEASDPMSFVSTPRAYLNPNPAGAGVSASPLRAVVQADGDTLTGVVPAGLTPGSYDLIIVNPTGEVGLLESALTVTQNEPPVITSVTPATFANNTDYVGTIAGENFDAAGATVDLTCEAPDGTRTDYPTTVTSTTATEVEATLPTGSLTKGTVCVVIVTNPDGASFTFSAISITNSSFNLEPWQATTAMTTARRGLALEAGRPTQTSRNLYAIGGDDGMAANTFTSVEYSPVSIFGDLGQWIEQSYALPAPRAFAGKTRIGRFIYLVGGSDGTAAQDTAWRAQVLDPLATPSIDDVDATLGDGTNGVGEGVWIYRVAAVYPAGDASNPDGESLPGDPQVIELPQIDDLIELTINWEVDPRASAYRVYRTPVADDSIDNLQLLAEVAAPNTSYTDLGGATDPAITPLQDGETGTWHPVGNLGTAREGLSAISAPLPGTTDQYAIYAIGGRDGATFIDTIEYAVVTVAADGSQTVSAWQLASGTLGAGKAYLGSFGISNFDAAVVTPGSTWIYAGPGEGSGGTYVDDLEAFEVTMTGDVGGFQTVNRPISGDRAGYGYGDSNGYLYIFGGQGGAASDGAISAVLCDAVGGPCGTVPPDLQSGAWNSVSIAMSEPRLYSSVAQESAFYFVAGGSNDTGAATNSVDTTVQ